MTVGLSVLNASVASLSSASLVFGTADWNVSQSVVVQGINNGIADGTKTTSLVQSTSSSDPMYSGLRSNVTFTVLDAAQVRLRLLLTSCAWASGAGQVRNRVIERAVEDCRALGRALPDA